MSDLHCQSLRIPERLHREDRPLLAFEDSEERLFRRFPIAQDNMEACIKFGDMSVNRERLSTTEISLVEDVLINEKTGELYEECGVAVFDVKSLRSTEPDGLWRVEDVLGAFELRPKHAPNICNYSHSEIEVYKDGAKQRRIKPTLVKLAIRYHLRSRISVALPTELKGKVLKMEPDKPIDDPT